MPIKISIRCNVNLDEGVPHASNQIVLVTPVWNDSARLQGFGADLAKALAVSPLSVRWVIADDGSDPVEQDRLVAMVGDFFRIFPNVFLHQADAHRGKGSIIREAWALMPDVGWYAFVDADGSVSANDLMGLLKAAVDSGRSVLGVRRKTASTKISMSKRRRLVHYTYRWIVRTWFGLCSSDPQCGVKILRGVDYRRVADGLSENGFAFDSELLIRLARSGCDWREIAVSWAEKESSKIKFLRDAWDMMAALWRLH